MSDLNVLHTKASDLFEQQRFEECISACEQLHQEFESIVKPNDQQQALLVDSYYFHGCSLVLLGHYEEGLKVFTLAKQTSNDRKFDELLGDTYSYLGDYESAITCFQRSIDENILMKIFILDKFLIANR